MEARERDGENSSEPAPTKDRRGAICHSFRGASVGEGGNFLKRRRGWRWRRGGRIENESDFISGGWADLKRQLKQKLSSKYIQASTIVGRVDCFIHGRGGRFVRCT